MRATICLALTALACGAPTSSEEFESMLCDIPPAANSPAVNPYDVCRLVRVVPDYRLTRLDVRACDVLELGRQCLEVAPMETFRVWNPAGRPELPPPELSWVAVECGTPCL